MAAVAKKPSLAAPKIDPVSNSIFEKKSMQFFYFLQRSLKYFQSPHNDNLQVLFFYFLVELLKIVNST